MAERTHISWTDHTFNPWMGCTKVSLGAKGACEGCYAEHLVQTRMGRAEWGNHPRTRTSVSYWRQPLAWNRKAAAAGTRPFVFCASLADVFDNQVDPEWRRDLFDLIHATPRLVWLLLTKRPQNIKRLFIETMMSDGLIDFTAREWPRNAAIGCTIVTQAEADRDLPHLLAAKAALRPAFAFVSMEPLMGPVNLTMLHYDGVTNIDALRGRHGLSLSADCERLDWVIAGGETDQGVHKARPADGNWYRSLRDQCTAARVAFHFKQHGEWIDVRDLRQLLGGSGPGFGDFDHCSHDMEVDAVRVGKRASGRLLDGVLHDVRPSLKDPPHAL
jgi:protein gp37